MYSIWPLQFVPDMIAFLFCQYLQKPLLVLEHVQVICFSKDCGNDSTILVSSKYQWIVIIFWCSFENQTTHYNSDMLRLLTK